MAELTSRFNWLLELSSEELVLVVDALSSKLTTPERVAAARELGERLLSRRVSEMRRKR